MMKEKVIIVEDEALVAMAIKNSLSNLGYDIAAVTDSGEDAIVKAQQIRPDIILMDINLNGKMDGIEAADQIRCSLKIPIIFISTLADEYKLQQAKLAVPYGYLLKPFQERELKVTIEMALYSFKLNAERDTAERALRLSRFSIEHAEDMLFWLDANGKILDVNETSAQRTGFAKHELKNMSIFELLPHLKTKQWEKNWHYLKNHKTLRLESVCSTKNKTKEFPVEVTCSYFCFDGKEYNCAFAKDISDRYQAREAVRRSENKFRWLYDNSPNMYASMDVNTLSIMECNQTLLHNIGYSKNEIIGQSVLKLYFQEDIEKIKTELFPLFNRTGLIEGEELRLQKKNGQLIDVRLTMSAICDDQGDVVYGHTVWYDITDQKKMRYERAELERQLFQSRKMESLGALAGGIAHDFNNILFQIMGYTQVFYKKSNKNREIVEYLDTVMEASNRASTLVQQILTFSRGTIGELQPLVIQPIIKEILKLMRSAIPAGIEIRQNINEQCGVINGDPTQIYQMVLNVCTNAYYSMRESGGVLDIILDEIQLQNIKYVEMTIKDTGSGMDEKTLSKVFDPYFTTKPIGQGTGLGLSIVKDIVEKHDGIINVLTSLGQGTTVTIRLPSKPETPLITSRILEELPHGSEHILIVDDEFGLVNMEKEILTGIGYQVTGFTNSLEALADFHLNSPKYDLVITDQTMPFLNGMELTKRFMKLKPDIPIILLTGYSDTLSEEQAVAAGIKKYLMKPLDIGVLACSIREILGQ